MTFPTNFPLSHFTGGGWCFVAEKQKKGIKFDSLDFGDSYRIQTCNLLIRSQMLYSVELRSQILFEFHRGAFLKCDAKVHIFF